MRRTWTIVPLLLAAALAGCMADETTYELRGTFTEDASQEQRDELRAEVEDRGGSFAELESFPVQFHADGLDPKACEEVRAFAQEADHVREVGECRVDDETGDGDESTSNGS